MLLIIDLQHIYYRCWFTRASQVPIMLASGRNVSHVKATFEECLKIIQDFEFHYDEDSAAICVCLDTNRDSLVKRQKYPEYKANRGATLDEVNRAEIRYIAKALEKLGATLYGSEGYEADDYVYSLVHDYANVDKVIYTIDADLLMHVNKTTDVWIRKGREYVRVKQPKYAHQVSFIGGKKHLTAMYNDMVLYKSSVGDVSDNIKGITRYGDKAYEKKIKELSEAYPDLVIPADYDGTLSFAKQYMGFTANQLEQFEYALGMVYPYYCDGLEVPKEVSLKPFLKRISTR